MSELIYNKKIKIVFDMETGDPDDVLTLMMLCDHPRADLRAVTITPGSVQQLDVVNHVLGLMGRRGDVEVGAFNIDHPKSCVSSWHYKTFGTAEEIEGEIIWDDVPGWYTLLNNCGPDVTLLTGAPLKNIGALLSWSETASEDEPRWIFGRWVAQGGFAGEGVVEPDKQLEKFKGMKECPTYNFNGDPKSAMKALSSPERFPRVLCVSKNVCHGQVMTEDLRARMSVAGFSSRRRSLEKVALHCPEGKALHDPLAMAVALDESVCTFKPVDLYRHHGAWGSTINNASHVNISVDVDRGKFERVLLE
jgi:inosine-uridine nucleoside N-ribohydrolase